MLVDSPEVGWAPLRQSGRGRLLLELVPRAAWAKAEETFATLSDKEPWDIASAGFDAERTSDADADEDDDDDDYVDVFLTDFEARPPNYGTGQLESAGTVPASRRQQMLMAACRGAWMRPRSSARSPRRPSPSSGQSG